MIKKALIVSGYGSEALLPFGESIKDILVNSLNDIGISAEHNYCEKTIIDNALVIFITPPERIKDARKLVTGTGNTYIWWNVEPFDTDGSAGIKLKNRRDLVKEIIDSDIIDKMWCYDDVQTQYLDNPKCYFLPIGYHECLEPKKHDKKIKKRMFVFLGHPSSYRITFLRVVIAKLNIEKKVSIKHKIISYKTFKNTQLTAINLGQFMVALDMAAVTNINNVIRWHRLMTYAGADLVILSSSDLSKYGFIDGKHYFHFIGAKDFALTVDKLFNDFDKITRVQKNMKAKVKKNFYMPNLLKNAIDKI